MENLISENTAVIPNAGKVVEMNASDSEQRFLVVLSLRKANADDLKTDKKTLKIGQPFWLRGSDGRFDNKPLFVSRDIDQEEVKQWLQYDMIYVPASSVE